MHSSVARSGRPRGLRYSTNLWKNSASSPDNDETRSPAIVVVDLFALEAGTGGGLLPPPPPPDGPASIGFKSVVALFALEAGTGGGLNEVDSESLEAAL